MLPSITGKFQYSIVNLGSNPARFAFFYENVNGANLSTGTQDLYMDLCILKQYKNRIKNGAYVLLPIVPFSSITAYLTQKKLGTSYFLKFHAINWCKNSEDLKIRDAAKKRLKYPLCYNPIGTLKAIIHDSERDKRLEITEMNMMYADLITDAAQWMEGWKQEFDIEDLNTPLNATLTEARKKSVEMFREIINYCILQGYKPIIILPPIQKELGKLFTSQIKEIYIDSFIREFENYHLPYFDYMKDERFSESNLFFNTLFMNLRGRKQFTNEILKKLNINE